MHICKPLTNATIPAVLYSTCRRCCVVTSDDGVIWPWSTSRAASHQLSTTHCNDRKLYKYNLATRGTLQQPGSNATGWRSLHFLLFWFLLFVLSFLEYYFWHTVLWQCEVHLRTQWVFRLLRELPYRSWFVLFTQQRIFNQVQSNLINTDTKGTDKVSVL